MDNEDETMKRINLWLHGPDRKIIDAMKRQYGCSATAAIRACIRIAAQVKLNLDQPLPTNAE